MKRVNIKCPCCGSRALLRPASVVYGLKANDPAAPYCVCACYPACNSYVTAHTDTCLPMGIGQCAKLRQCIEAHAVFNQLWQSDLMSRKEAYRWLQLKLGLPETENHIGKLSGLKSLPNCALVQALK